jgi:hypothetical protein
MSKVFLIDLTMQWGMLKKHCDRNIGPLYHVFTLFLHQELLLLQVRTFQQHWTVMIHCFKVRVELQPLSWKKVHCKTLLIDGMEMLMALVVDLSPSHCLLENFLQEAL